MFDLSQYLCSAASDIRIQSQMQQHDNKAPVIAQYMYR